MASFPVPQVKVFQDFVATRAAVANPQYAFVIGPNYHLVRYAAGDSAGRLGQYNPASDVAYLWPNRPAGGVVDQDFTKVTIENALLRYYFNQVGSGSDEVKAVAGYRNRIRAEAVNFKENGDSYPRAAALYDRDVAVGDIVRAYANVGGDTYELWSRITDILPDYSVPTVQATADDDADNSGDLVAGVNNGAGSNITNTGTGGGSRSITAIVGAGGYDGIADGFPYEVYTVEITTASSSFAGALATVTSASGTDDATDVAIELTGQEIGSRGLTFNWAGSGEFNVGDKFVIHAKQLYDAPVVTADGDFDSDADTTYIVEITRGGTADGSSSAALFSVSTTNGLDVSGPHIADTATSIAIGTKGVTLQFTVGSGDAKLPKGYKYYIACTGRAEQGYKTLVLADTLPEALRAASSSSSSYGTTDVGDSPDLNLKIFARRTLELSRANYGSAPDTNWDQSATELTFHSGATARHDDFVDSDGEPLDLVLEADTAGQYSVMFVTYRALLQTYATEIASLDDSSLIESAVGPISVDNPLALGLYYALLNSNGRAVRFAAVPTDDAEGYSTVLSKAVGRRDIYTVVPLTKDATIQGLIASHVANLSNEIKGQWRICFLNGDSSAQKALIAEGEIYPTGGEYEYAADDLLATVTDDDDTSGTQYTIVTWADAPAGGGFLDMGTRAGDIYKTNFVGDGFGNTSSDSYVIDAVLSNQSLRLVSGPASAINVARAFTVERTQTRNEEATAYGNKAAAFASRRVYYVWPDVVEDLSGAQISGIYLCSAIAGLISGVVPQQGLTNIEIAGFSGMTRTVNYYGEDQLDLMRERGVWIVTQDPESGVIYTLQQVSTKVADLTDRELSIVKNVDSISYTFMRQLQPFIGRANINPRLFSQIRRQVQSTVDYLMANGASPTLGGQLLSAQLVELRQHAINLDQLVATLNITVPFPLNVLELHLVI